MPDHLIDRIGRALLLCPMGFIEMADALSAEERNVRRELRHLVDSSHVAITNRGPVRYFLTRKGREWAQGFQTTS